MTGVLAAFFRVQWRRVSGSGDPVSTEQESIGAGQVVGERCWKQLPQMSATVGQMQKTRTTDKIKMEIEWPKGLRVRTRQTLRTCVLLGILLRQRYLGHILACVSVCVCVLVLVLSGPVVLSCCNTKFPSFSQGPGISERVQTSQVPITWAFSLLHESDPSHICWVAWVFGHCPIAVFITYYVLLCIEKSHTGSTCPEKNF